MAKAVSKYDKWELLSDKIAESPEELKEILLQNRDLKTKKAINEFLDPKNPIDLNVKTVGLNPKDVKKAVKRIKQAIKAQQKIVVYGDYDADGICATAILWSALFDLYKKVSPKIIDSKAVPAPFIPDRDKHGYGISEIAIDEIITNHNPDIIITVDNGIVAFKAIEYARNKGLEVIITDHHQTETENDQPKLPFANVILHSTQLCGASVAWMFARELNLKSAQESLDLCGIATIADQVPLSDANRSFAKYGIKALRETTRIGLKELFKEAGIVQKEINEGTIGFAIAPRINAMGRIQNGINALRLICTVKKGRARELAKTLAKTNVERQDLTTEMVDEARTQVKLIAGENLIIVHSTEYHEGILGLIAGRLTEEYNKPSIAISLGDKVAKGSARSMPGVNIVDILREIRDDLIAVGGHPLAAGFGFETEKITVIKERLFALAKIKISPNQLEKKLKIECEINPDLVSEKIVADIEKLSPFGIKNPRPSFKINNLKILEVKTIGEEQKHLKLKVAFENKDGSKINYFDCLGWGMSEFATKIKTGDKISVAGTLDTNSWRNVVYPQVIIKDIRLNP
jgi:single-stranded-DNA-specific exonuclease